MANYLTKSKFKLAVECPAKLYYSNHPEYVNNLVEDPFLKALAENGREVGVLARTYYPQGILVSETDADKAIKQTKDLLNQDSVVIFEGALAYGNLLVRCDIIEKTGTKVKLIEVKAAGIRKSNSAPFQNKSGTIKSTWKPRLFDIAFQQYVADRALRGMNVEPFLMVPDKEALHPNPLLTEVNVQSLCNKLRRTSEGHDSMGNTFAQRVKLYSDALKNDIKLDGAVTKLCKDCQFRATDDELAQGMKCGYRECWGQLLGWQPSDFAAPTVYHISSFRRADELVSRGIVKMEDASEEDIGSAHYETEYMSQAQRQWLQVKKVKYRDSSVYCDVKGLKTQMDSWTFPLHFIDMETTRPAIPYTKDRKPYEGIAFQFSHHIVTATGEIRHETQYLDSRKGHFPNLDFVRALKNALDQDNGTILMYSSHENSVLSEIYNQIQADAANIPDATELSDFIQSITQSPRNHAEDWKGPRCMVDMCQLVKRYYYDPATGGSNSIKEVLPAILNSSDYLKKKYAKPIYGDGQTIQSANFTNWIWIEQKNGLCIDPYKLLPPVGNSPMDALADGGAALTAYHHLQSDTLSKPQKQELEKALLRYCELDTFAMVMIYEEWREILAGRSSAAGNSAAITFFDIDVHSDYWLGRMKNLWASLYSRKLSNKKNSFGRYFLQSPGSFQAALQKLPYGAIVTPSLMKLTKSTVTYDPDVPRYCDVPVDEEDRPYTNVLNAIEEMIGPLTDGNTSRGGSGEKPFRGTLPGGGKQSQVTVDCYGLYVGSFQSWVQALIKAGYNYPDLVAIDKEFQRGMNDGPAVLLCPELIQGLESYLKSQSYLKANKAEDAFDAVFYHEVGHHLFPVHKDSTFLGEAYANWFAFHCLPKEQRLTLWAKSRNQAPEYRAFEALLTLQFASKWELPFSHVKVCRDEGVASILAEGGHKNSFQNAGGSWKKLCTAISKLSSTLPLKGKPQGRMFPQGITPSYLSCIQMHKYLFPGVVQVKATKVMVEAVRRHVQYAEKQSGAGSSSQVQHRNFFDLVRDVNGPIRDRSKAYFEEYKYWCGKL